MRDLDAVNSCVLEGVAVVVVQASQGDEAQLAALAVGYHALLVAGEADSGDFKIQIISLVKMITVTALLLLLLLYFLVLVGELYRVNNDFLRVFNN